MTPSQIETEQHRALCDRVWSALREWRRFLIAVDGADGAGKSTLARYLSWQLGMPAVETDLFLDKEAGGFAIREQDLARVLRARLDCKRPVIVEGVFLLRTLSALALEPDYVVFVEQADHEGSHLWAGEFARYYEEHRPQDRAQFLFRWHPAVLDCP